MLPSDVFCVLLTTRQTGYLRPLESSDIPLVAPNRSASVITEKLQAAFQRRRERGDKYPLVWSLNEVFFNEFWFAGASRLFGDVCLIINPFLLKYLIRFAVESYTAIQTGGKGPNLGYGVGLAIVISFIQACVTITLSQFVYLSMMTGGQARAGLIGMVFEKALVISARAKAGGDAAAAFVMVTRAQQERKDKKSDREKGKKKKTKKEEDTGWSNGRVVNLMGTDTYRVDQAAGWFHVIWTAPVMMILTLILLLINLGVAALAGIAVLCVGVPVLSWVVKTIARRRKRMNLITDKRVTLTQEILMGVRFVKYFGWEESFLSRLQELRDREISAVQFLLGIRSAVNAVGMSLPIFASMLAFITYSLTHKDLDAATVFSSLALFNALRFPLNLLPMVAAQTIDAWVSIGRLQEYLLAEEITDRVIYQEDMEPAVLVKDGNFTWERPPPEEEKKKKKTSRKQRRLDALEEKSQPTPITGSSTPLTPFQLEAINLAVGRHELLAVVGSVGSGKSSLLAALAGGMRATGGSVTMSSKIAYCPQYAWIQNATVRENIVFGKEFNQEWYDTVVRACALERDLDMLPDGDMTEIGERGITVSGGQKQRLNIARAIYFNTDIVLMDDPLSAVDALVGRHLFDKAICGMLKDKCRILATHQLHVLEKVDRVMWMEDGRIQAIGTFHELMRENPGFAEMMKEISTDKRDIDDGKTKTDEREEKDEIEVNESEEGDDEKEAEKKVPAKALILMQVEERGSNSVSWKVYESYIKSSGSIWVGPIIIFLLCLGQASNIITTLWLSYWTSDVYGLSNGAYVGLSHPETIHARC